MANPHIQASSNEAIVNSVGSKKQLFSFLFTFVKPYKFRLFAALLALLITTAITLSLGQGIRLLIDEGIALGSVMRLQQLLWLAMGFVLILAVATYARFYLISSLGEQVVADIRTSLFNHIITLHPSYFEQNRGGEIMSRLTTDTTLLQTLIGSSLSFALRSALMMLGGLILMLLTNWQLALWVLLSVPLVLLPVLLFGKQVRKLSRASQDRIADVGTYAGEIIQQIKTVQSSLQQHAEQSAFAKEVTAAFVVAKQRIHFRAVLMAVAILLSFLAILSMIWLGGKQVVDGELLAGELASFLFYAMLVAAGVVSLSEIIGELQRAAGASERLMQLATTANLVAEADGEQALDTQSAVHIEFKQVDFSYPTRPSSLALQSINLQVNRGETLAVVGHSGAGKSTLFELLLRFYDVSAGSIVIDAVNIKQQSFAQLRAGMAWVPQQPLLFSQDILYNIRYACPAATEQQVQAAAEQANAHDFIMALPDGYQTFVGEGGVRLSGGQKQRIVIARAILQNPVMLLLDEATSALDSQNEYVVQQALTRLMAQRTTLIIAHRLATIQHADRIVVMDQGHVVDVADESTLLIRCPLYQQLAKHQLLKNA